MKQLYNILFLAFLFSFGCQNNKLFAAPKNDFVIYEGKKLDIDTLIIAKYKNKNLMLFYKNFEFRTIWQSRLNRNIILYEISKSGTDGLNPNDYSIELLSEYETKIDNLNDKQLVEYDVLLTNSLQNYLLHLVTGKLNPRKLYSDWDLKEKEFELNKLLFEAYANDSFALSIEKAKPRQLIYLSLKKALQIIEALPEDYSKPIAFLAKQKINPNENNSVLISVKKRLMFWNYLKKIDTITKNYDKKTQIAIKEFQENHGLIADGIIGKSTINALNYFKNERKEQIIANLERWRWFPEDFGANYTIVNIPDFTINAIKNGDTLLHQKVIVGTEKRKSPVLSSKLSYVVFNPTWTVPPTIIKEDLIPDATKSRSYFRKMNIIIYDNNKNKINPWTWKPENARKYTYVQDPGNHNSLGNMKIIFPNKFSVYLHDTNHKDGFSRNYRSLSSGCTRVEKPLELAQYVLNDSLSWNSETIDAVLKTKKTKNVTISQIIKHYQLYWTAWTKKNRLIFRDDIYNLDFDLYCKLRH